MSAYSGNLSGELRHSVIYRSMDEFKDKRVLIVGPGTYRKIDTFIATDTPDM
jgi:hypothetical protein